MLGISLDSRARRTLTVTVGDDAQVDVDDTPGPYFPLRVSAPEGGNTSADTSPRTGLTPHTLWWDAQDLGPGDRITVFGGDMLELLAKPAPINQGRRVQGYTVSALPAGVLYPLSAEVYEQGAEKNGDDPIGTVAVSLYSPSEEIRGAGDYANAFAEAHASDYELLRVVNRTLALGPERWRITEASLYRELPYVAMRVKRA